MSGGGMATRLTNPDELAAAIQSAQTPSTPVALAGGAPAALTANVSTSVGLASPALSVTLNNKSAVDINYNPDGAATAGSDAVYAGERLTLTFSPDDPCTAIAFLATAAVPVNGSAGSNLIITAKGA
jgi:hypothetical protein